METICGVTKEEVKQAILDFVWRDWSGFNTVEDLAEVLAKKHGCFKQLRVGKPKQTPPELVEFVDRVMEEDW